MSEVVENVSEQNSAQSTDVAAPPAETVADVTINNVDSAIKSVPEAESVFSATNENADDSVSKDVEKSTSPKVDNKKTPIKRTPSKRMSFIERAQRESEELVKNMGGSLEIEGGRKTRSSTRGTPTRTAVTSTPPPTKKARNSPASGASTPTRARGRGRKIDVADDAVEEEENKPTAKKTPTKGKKPSAKEVLGDEEEAENSQETTELEKETEATEREAAKSCKETEAAVQVVEQLEEDKTDASTGTAADLLPTEKNITTEPENKKAPVNISEASESIKSDSPMDTTDDTKLTDEPEKNEDRQNVKEPTPEPMEIDSSPDVEKHVIEINDEDEGVQESSTVNCIELVNNSGKVEGNIKENSVAPSAIITSPADIVANNSIGKPAEVAGVAGNDLNKTQNDLCEPKIATSPPISAANDSSTVTTPQTCN